MLFHLVLNPHDLLMSAVFSLGVMSSILGGLYAKLSDIHANEIGISLRNGDATGIADVKSQTEDGILYNLAGQRVSKGQLKSGLYIINGKKTTYKKK